MEADQLPYRLCKRGGNSEESVSAYFKPIEAQDLERFRASLWKASLFHSAWEDYIEAQSRPDDPSRTTYKLMVDNDTDIQGLLDLSELAEENGTGKGKTWAALEGAPWNIASDRKEEVLGKYLSNFLDTPQEADCRKRIEEIHSRQPTYHGVGRVLVARLLAESILAGRGGECYIEPVEKAEEFYRNLGFEVLPVQKTIPSGNNVYARMEELWFITAENAQTLLCSTLEAGSSSELVAIYPEAKIKAVRLLGTYRMAGGRP